MIDEPLSAGVIAFIGVPGRLGHASPEERVIGADPERGLDLLPRIKAILNELENQDPPLLGCTARETAGRARQFTRERHPELSNEAVTKVGTAYAVQWK